MTAYHEALAAIKRGMESQGLASASAYEGTGLTVETTSPSDEPPLNPADEPEECGTFSMLDDLGLESMGDLSDAVEASASQSVEAVIHSSQSIPEPIDDRYAYAGEAADMGELGRIYLAIVETAAEFRAGHTRPGRRVTLDDGANLQTYVYSNSKCAYLRTPTLLYVEQNPKKASKYAEVHNAGQFVVWVIQHQTDTYLGYIRAGHVYLRR